MHSSGLPTVCNTAGQLAGLRSRSARASPGTACGADPEQCLAWAAPLVLFIKRAGRRAQWPPVPPSHSQRGERTLRGVKFFLCPESS